MIKIKTASRMENTTFTYTFSIQALRIRTYSVKYDKDFLNDTTDHFEHLVHTLYDAFDRMVMQSDFRDVYNGIQLANFSVNKIPENKEFKLAYDNLIVNFLLQITKTSILLHSFERNSNWLSLLSGLAVSIPSAYEMQYLSNSRIDMPSSSIIGLTLCKDIEFSSTHV
uniref:SEA domain-containing protein n=1 Tax=Glossina austeni TaxID=7395 RepID=A0A1A9V3K2_GLOAU